MSAVCHSHGEACYFALPWSQREEQVLVTGCSYLCTAHALLHPCCKRSLTTFAMQTASKRSMDCLELPVCGMLGLIRTYRNDGDIRGGVHLDTCGLSCIRWHHPDTGDIKNPTRGCKVCADILLPLLSLQTRLALVFCGADVEELASRNLHRHPRCSISDNLLGHCEPGLLGFSLEAGAVEDASRTGTGRVAHTRDAFSHSHSSMLRRR
mmetsp:Transcript_58028/g.135710  ORF Transcript_58028/g.135710 Transcript_58028/m.135710 type:complete len:209 (-) Transcript_58028:257-883(-)